MLIAELDLEAETARSRSQRKRITKNPYHTTPLERKDDGIGIRNYRAVNPSNGGKDPMTSNAAHGNFVKEDTSEEVAGKRTTMRFNGFNLHIDIPDTIRETRPLSFEDDVTGKIASGDETTHYVYTTLN